MHFPIITSKCQDNFQMLLCALLVPTYVTRMHPRLDDLAISMNCQQQLESSDVGWPLGVPEIRGGKKGDVYKLVGELFKKSIFSLEHNYGSYVRIYVCTQSKKKVSELVGHFVISIIMNLIGHFVYIECVLLDNYFGRPS